MNKTILFFISFISLLFFVSENAFSGGTDYFDRFLIYQGLEKGIIYKSGKTDLSSVLLKTTFGYGLDDDKILNMSLTYDTDFNRLFCNPEFMLLLNEFSSLKIFLTVGLDFKVINSFETSIRTSEGFIIDIFKHFSLLLGVDNRFNIYDEFYVESLALISIIIRI